MSVQKRTRTSTRAFHRLLRRHRLNSTSTSKGIIVIMQTAIEKKEKKNFRPRPFSARVSEMIVLWIHKLLKRNFSHDLGRLTLFFRLLTELTMPSNTTCKRHIKWFQGGFQRDQCGFYSVFEMGCSYGQFHLMIFLFSEGSNLQKLGGRQRGICSASNFCEDVFCFFTSDKISYECGGIR